MKKIRKLAALLLTLAMALGLAACSNSGEGSQNSSAPASQPAGEESAAPAGEGGSGEAMDPSQVKVALLLPGTITDAGWSAAAYNGLMEAQETFGIQVDYAESVALTEQETTMRDYAAQGYNLIICHGDEFADAASTVADEFPDVSFAVTNAVLDKPNAIGMDVKNEEQGYIAGYALGYGLMCLTGLPVWLRCMRLCGCYKCIVVLRKCFVKCCSVRFGAACRYAGCRVLF